MPDFSADCLEVLRLLRDRHNVLVSGPPGTGKSRLLSEVARAFRGSKPPGPTHVPGAAVAIPRTPPVSGSLKGVMPSPSRTDREVFPTVFHQNSKHRDFVTGLAPDVGAKATSSGTAFRVVTGTMYRASQHALTKDGAALLLIDEINRGPAVQVFGGSIVAIESDKRLAPDGSLRDETLHFELLDPESGELRKYALPHHLYILGAMNQADTSVEPLDVAFLRRWMPFTLGPDANVLREHWSLPPTGGYVPEKPAEVSDVYEVAVRAWSAVNDRIRLGRGPEFQIGHGVLMTRAKPGGSIKEALEDVAESWRLVRAHIDEVFFGDVRGIAAVLNVGASTIHVYQLKDTSFAEEPRLDLVGPALVAPAEIYALLRAVAG